MKLSPLGRGELSFASVLAVLLTLVLWAPSSAADTEQSEQHRDDLRMSSVAVQGPTDPKEVEAFLDSFMPQKMEEHHVPGAAFVLVKDGKILFSKGYGYADLERKTPMSPEKTTLRIWSLSKSFAFAALMRLHEQEPFGLDDDVNEYMKDIRVDETYPEPVTFANLLTHTDGFEDRTVGVGVRSGEDLRPLGEFLKETLPHRVVPPGEMISYGNYGSVLAGYLIEEISGMSFERYVDESIFDPAGMQNSTFVQPVPERFLSELGKEYEYKDGSYKSVPVLAFYANVVQGGGMTSTVADQGRFIAALLRDGQGEDEDGRVMSEESVRGMFHQQFTAHPHLPGTTYGFMEHFENGVRGVRRDGFGTESRGRMFLLPEQDVGFYFYYNRGENALRDEFTSRFLDHYYPAPDSPTPKATAGFQERADNLTGVYAPVQTDRHTYGRIQVLFAGLMKVSENGDSTLKVTPLNFDAYSGLGEPTIWSEAEPLFFARAEEEGYLAFEEDRSAGRTYMYTGTGFLGSYEKLWWYERPIFHGIASGLILLIFLSAFPMGLLWFIRHRRSEPQPPKTDRLARAGSWSVVATSVLNSVFLVGTAFGAFVAGGAAAGLPSYAFGPNPLFVGMMWLSLLVAAVPLGLLVLAVLVWKKRAGSLLFRLYVSAYVIAAIGFVWLLNYWNLLGFRY